MCNKENQIRKMKPREEVNYAHSLPKGGFVSNS